MGQPVREHDDGPANDLLFSCLSQGWLRVDRAIRDGTEQNPNRTRVPGQGMGLNDERRVRARKRAGNMETGLRTRAHECTAQYPGELIPGNHKGSMYAIV